MAGVGLRVLTDDVFAKDMRDVFEADLAERTKVDGY